MKKKSFILLIFFFLYIISCSKLKKGESPVVARVGNETLTKSELDSKMPDIYGQKITKNQKHEYIKKWVNREIMFLEAKNQEIHKEKQIAEKIERMKKDLLGSELLERNTYISSNDSIPEETMEKYYKTNKEHFKRKSDEIKFQKIVVTSLTQGWHLRKMLTPDNFHRIGKNNSIEKIVNPDSIVFTPKNNVREEFQKIVFNIRKNGISSPVKIGDKCYIFYIIDKKDAGTIKTFEQVKDEIKFRLNSLAYQKEIDDYVQNLRDKYNFIVNTELLE